MSDIGPALPPHLLAKRKRKQEEDVESDATAGSGAERSSSPGDGEKRRRVIGPAMPPAPLDERPIESSKHLEGSDSDDEDDFGPALSTASNEANDYNAHGQNGDEVDEIAPSASTSRPQRDAWMTMPPQQDDLAARMDPGKQRARAFNTGKGARGPNSLEDDHSAWHETPEQKQKRLADEMMGVTKPSGKGPPKLGKRPAQATTEATAKNIREHTDKTRGPSLLDQHQGRSDKEPEDDPSQRAFDRDKDMGSGMRIGHAQKKEMLNKAANFSSKFSGGSYL